MAIGVDDTVDDPLGLEPSSSKKPDTYSAIKPIRLGEADEVGGKVASVENRLNDAAEEVGFGGAVSAAFKSGDNFGYQLYKRYEREQMSPAPDPSFKPDDYIARNRKVIPQHLEMQFRMATSEAEANALLADVTQELRDQDMLERRGGFSTFVARGLAGILDIDTPISFGVGMLFKGGVASTKIGRMAQGATAGATTQMAAAGLAFEAGTTQDWTSIPAAGLGGMAFGALGASFGKKLPEDLANDAKMKVLQELDETIVEGTPLAKRDIRTEVHTTDDPYKAGRDIQLREQAEVNTQAEPAVRNKSLRQELDDINQKEKDVGFAVGENDPVTKALRAAVSDIDTPAPLAKEHIANAVAARRQDIALAIVERAEKAAEAANAKGGDDIASAAAKARGDEAKALREAFQTEVAKPASFDFKELGLRPDSLGENTGPRVWQVGDKSTDAGSVGARNMNTQGSVADVTSRRSLEIIVDAQKREQQDGLVQQYDGKSSPMGQKGAAGDAVEKAANRFHDVIRASGLTTDFDRLMRSGSIVAQRLAIDLMESASGIVRNNRSASMLKDYFEKKLLGSFLPAYGDAYKLWANSQGMSLYDRITDSAARATFNKELALELNGRAFDPPGTVRNVHPAVKAAADAHDRWSALELEIGRGRPNEMGVAGYDKVKSYSGYMPQRWSNDKMEQLIRTGKTEKQLVEAVSEAYRSLHPWMTQKDADKWAAAVVRRSRTSGLGADTNLIGVLQSDGRGYLEKLLTDNGMPTAETMKLIDRLTGAVAERGQAGHTKGRIDVDMRYTAKNGIQLIDMFDTDFVRTVSRRSRGTAGAAALARKGITNAADRNEIIEAILHEQQARGRTVPTGDKINDLIDQDRHLTRKDIEDLFSYFDAGPVAGGNGVLVSNIKKLTNLALLNQLGLTQMGEFGAQIASVGISRWWDHAGSALKKQAMDPKSELVRELKHMDVLVPEERLFRDDLNLEMDKAGAASSELAMKAQTLLNQGQRLQGYISGFYAMRNIQQRIAVTSAADKIMTNMKGLANDLSDARAADLGLDPKTYARINKYVNDGTVEFKDGNLYKLNFEKWDPDVVEDFALSLNRHVNQVVQKAMAGESNILFHRDGIAGLFFHLKSFPMLALEKQLLRNVRMGDAEAMSVFLTGMVTSAMAYTAKQAVNGREENLTPIKIAKGAFGYSNMTGWIPMWTDPIAGMLGLQSLRFNEYNQGLDNAIIGAPAALSTLNRMAAIPGAVGNIIVGEKTNNDIRALQATPIIGNAYGFNYLWNNWKEPSKKRKAATDTQVPDPAEELLEAN